MIRHLQDWPPGYRTRTVNITQGEFEVSNNPDVVISTVLGSCISVCLYDAESGIGGMNHYLLVDGAAGDRADLKYGAHSMELLINSLLRKGASRRAMRAKVYGGSTMSSTFSSIGEKNAEFAVSYLKDEGFPIIAKDTGGTDARRLNFHPVTGETRLGHTKRNVDPPAPLKPARPAVAKSDITLF